MAALLVSGCSTMPPFSTQPAFSPQNIDMDPYKARVENVVVVLDASESMRIAYNGSTRFEAAKALVSRMNQTLPSLNLNAGLRTFGHSRSVSSEKTALIYGMASYTRTGLQDGLDKVTKADGSSPIESAIDGVIKDLSGTSGNAAVIIVSDGEAMGNGPVKAAMRLKEEYGSRVCIYTIAVGSTPREKVLMNELAQVGECGFSTDAEKVATSAGMAAFVEDVFLTKRMDDDHDGVFNDKDQCPETPQGVAVDMNGCPLDTDADGVADYLDTCAGTPQAVAVDKNGCAVDTDADGVADYLDTCAGTPEAVAVDKNGCPLDTDADGVVDYMDQCPETPSGEAVDTKGCPIPKATQSAKVTEAGTWLYEDIKFDSSSTNIKPASYPVLAEIAGVLNQNPNLKVEVQGHTDSAGGLAMNNKLSSDRANKVLEYLIGEGVNPEQMTAVGYGPSKPLVSNDTAEGKTRNRRVELKPLW